MTSAVLAAAASAMAEQPKHVFYDMVHSNNAARIRLWLALKEGAAEHVETCATLNPSRTAGPGRPRPAAPPSAARGPRVAITVFSHDHITLGCGSGGW